MPSWLSHALLFAAGLALGRHVGLIEGRLPLAAPGERVPGDGGGGGGGTVPTPPTAPATPPLPPAVSTKPKGPPPPVTIIPFPPASVGGARRRWWRS